MDHAFAPEASARKRRAKPFRPGGFTLMELVLVLVILVVLTSMGGLSLRGSLRHHSLQKAAEQVQVEWGRARAKSIKSGRVQVFYHAVNGRQFYTRGEASLDDPVPTMMGGTMGAGGMNGGMNGGMMGPGAANGGAGNAAMGAGGWGPAPPLDNTKVRELPNTVSFVGADVRIDQRTAVQLTGLARAAEESAFGPSSTSDPQQELAVEWGMPIYFFPDGTTSNAVLLLRNDRGLAVAVELRGITGGSRVGIVQPESSMDLSGVQP